MRFSVLAFFLLSATAAQAHEGGHMHPHETNSWLVSTLLFLACLAGGYLIARVHR